jgi:starch synthase
VFSGTDEASLDSALDCAIQDFQEQPQQWEQLANKNMAIDWSWQNSAAQYLGLYIQMLLS